MSIHRAQQKKKKKKAAANEKEKKIDSLTQDHNEF